MVELVISLSMDFILLVKIWVGFFVEEEKRNYFKIVSFWESSPNSSAVIKSSMNLAGISFIYSGNLALNIKTYRGDSQLMPLSGKMLQIKILCWESCFSLIVLSCITVYLFGRLHAFPSLNKSGKQKINFEQAVDLFYRLLFKTLVKISSLIHQGLSDLFLSACSHLL